MVELMAELEQLQASTHYYSDLPPSPEHYAEQWRGTAQRATEIEFCVQRLVEELARRGLMRADAKTWDGPAVEGISLNDAGRDDEVPL